jgi:transposase
MYRKETAREFQRRRAIELMEQGERTEVIAHVLGVSVGTLYKWRRIYRSGGSLELVPPKGRNRRLSDEQVEVLRKLLLQGASAHGWHNDLWTSKRVAVLIRRRFKVKFARSHVWRILRQYLGWTAQRPVRRVQLPDNIAIARWKAEVFPRVTDDAKRRRAYLVFLDESGFLLTPHVRRTFSPRGQAPIIKVADPHGKISIIGAVAISPLQKHLSFLYKLLPDNANFHSCSVLQFVRDIRRRLPGPMTILCDAYRIHTSKLMAMYLRRHSDLIVEEFPPNAPELNPVDRAWGYLKFARLPNYCPRTLAELRTRLTAELNALQKRKRVLAWCVRKTELNCDLQHEVSFQPN